MNYKQRVLEHYNVTIHTEYTSNTGYFFSIEETSTADGYEVYVAKFEDEPVMIHENVYYYDHDFEDLIADRLPDCQDETIYISDCVLDVDDLPWEEWYEQLNPEDDE